VLIHARPADAGGANRPFGLWTTDGKSVNDASRGVGVYPLRGWAVRAVGAADDPAAFSGGPNH
jgi:hypothetical protein